MENNENKKAPEELADEALEKVSGGDYEGWGSGDLVAAICSNCDKSFLTEQMTLRGDHYYCPDCGKQLV